MNISSVLKQLGISGVTLGILALLLSFYANATGDASSARGLLLTGFLGTFIGGSFLILLWDTTTKSGPREGLMLVLVFWVLTPAYTGFPFWASGVSETYIEAVFEAVSNLTTTGSTTGDLPQPESIRYWRASLQLFGGVSSVVLAVVVLAALNQTGPGIHRSHLLTLPKNEVLGRLNTVIMTVLAVYGVLVLCAVLIMATGGIAFIDAVTRSIAAITTSSTLPNTAGGYAYSSVGIFVIAFLLIVGASNVSLHTDIFRVNAWKRYVQDRELQSLLLGSLILGLIACWFYKSLDIRIFLNALSFITTSGMNISGTESLLNFVPQPIPELFVFVGASALSTAGGLKISRVIVLMNRAFIEFKRLAFDHSKAKLQFQGVSRTDSVVVGIFVYLVAYLGATILLGMALTLNGADIPTGFRAAIGAIANTGPLVDTLVLDQDPNSWTLILVSFGCILGRIEVLALAPLFSREFWRR